MTNEFIDGYLCGVQFVVSGHKDTAIAEDMIRASGFSEKDLLESQQKSGFENEKIIFIIKSIFKNKEM